MTFSIFNVKEKFLKSPAGYDSADYSSGEIDSATSHLLDQWVTTLPLTLSNRIVDLAAGIGIESRHLDQKGLNVSAYDKNAKVMRNMQYPVKQQDLNNLKLEKQRYAGALIKDALIFIPENERLSLLYKLHKALVNNGSILVISQIAYSMALVLPHNSRNPIKIYRSEHKDNNAWIRYVNHDLGMGGTLIDVVYDMNESIVAKEAKKAGFKSSIFRFGANDLMAVNNRWQKFSPGFVATLTN